MSEASPGPTPGFLVWRLSMKWRVAVDRALAPHGLTHAQYSLLGSLLGMQLSGRQPTQRELADHAGLEPLYVSKLARTLEGAGLVTRTPHPTDTRAVRLSLSDHGRETTERAVAIVHDLLDRQFAPLGGLDSPRTGAFARELTALLDAPLDSPTTSTTTSAIKE
ncbi:MarR family winged helix-turn-helix transcriptional regulator [Streptacidiphilus neutrinimicus]|uniref:MarR family winged helix-turn-helix transcriptional regulator n=1 Tax=Streptacidiphilus neutrinimicus TaxID=105420 RepID=UPI0005A8B783|nr:MarR family transcriptional regulator [Streptacidiphilus neutrinimicus]